MRVRPVLRDRIKPGVRISLHPTADRQFADP
jgi:hypothetical protein